MSSKKLDAAIDALVDALAELLEHELEGWQRGNRLGLRILCELGRRYPGIVQATGRFAASRREQSPPLFWITPGGRPSYRWSPCHGLDSLCPDTARSRHLMSALLD